MSSKAVCVCAKGSLNNFWYSSSSLVHLYGRPPGSLQEFVDAFKDYGDARFETIASVDDGKICWNTAALASCLFFTPNATLWVLAPDTPTLETVRAAIAF